MAENGRSHRDPPSSPSHTTNETSGRGPVPCALRPTREMQEVRTPRLIGRMAGMKALVHTVCLLERCLFSADTWLEAQTWLSKPRFALVKSEEHTDLVFDYNLANLANPPPST